MLHASADDRFDDKPSFSTAGVCPLVGRTSELLRSVRFFPCFHVFIRTEETDLLALRKMKKRKEKVGLDQGRSQKFAQEGKEGREGKEKAKHQ